MSRVFIPNIDAKSADISVISDAFHKNGIGSVYDVKINRTFVNSTREVIYSAIVDFHQWYKTPTAHNFLVATANLRQHFIPSHNFVLYRFEYENEIYDLTDEEEEDLVYSTR